MCRNVLTLIFVAILAEVGLLAADNLFFFEAFEVFASLDGILADPLGVAVSALEVVMVHEDMPAAFVGTVD